MIKQKGVFMYKLLSSLFIIVVVTLSCGGPKKETPKPVTTAPKFEALIKTIEPITVISMEKKGPYSEIGKTIGELLSWAIAKQVKLVGAPFGLYYDDPTKVVPESTRYEICMPVAIETKGDKAVKVKQLPQMEVASAIYTGPYDKVSATYGQLMTWIDQNNYSISGPAREIYISNPSAVPPESLKTEIQFPVKKKIQ
jgi:effector-binding domain-containing protein